MQQGIDSMAESLPGFSIVVPTYNRPAKLKCCLEALVELEYPRDRFEIIVVDDGSPTSLEPTVDAFRDRARIELVRQQNAGPASARNRGADRAKGEYVAFTDDDCRPERSWLRVLAKRIATSDGIAIGGHTTNGLPGNRFAAASQVIIDLVYQFYNPDPERSTFFASNNFACPVQAFRELGGFDERFFRAASEDRELCDRWLKSGRALVFAPEAVVYHYHDLGLRSFCRQHFNYGRGAYCFHRRRVERGATKFEIQMRFHVEAMRYPFRRERGLRALSLLSTLLVWQGANAAGFFYEALFARFASETGR